MTIQHIYNLTIIFCASLFLVALCSWCQEPTSTTKVQQPQHSSLNPNMSPKELKKAYHKNLYKDYQQALEKNDTEAIKKMTDSIFLEFQELIEGSPWFNRIQGEEKKLSQNISSLIYNDSVGLFLAELCAHILAIKDDRFSRREKKDTIENMFQDISQKISGIFSELEQRDRAEISLLLSKLKEKSHYLIAPPSHALRLALILSIPFTLYAGFIGLLLYAGREIQRMLTFPTRIKDKLVDLKTFDMQTNNTKDILEKLRNSIHLTSLAKNYPDLDYTPPVIFIQTARGFNPTILNNAKQLQDGITSNVKDNNGKIIGDADLQPKINFGITYTNKKEVQKLFEQARKTSVAGPCVTFVPASSIKEALEEWGKLKAEKVSLVIAVGTNYSLDQVDSRVLSADNCIKRLKQLISDLQKKGIRIDDDINEEFYKEVLSELEGTLTEQDPYLWINAAKEVLLLKIEAGKRSLSNRLSRDILESVLPIDFIR